MVRSKSGGGAKTSATRNGKNNVLKEKNSGKRILLLTAVFMLTVCSLTFCVSDQSEIQNVTADDPPVTPTPSKLTYAFTDESESALMATGFDPLETNKTNLVIPATAMFGTPSESYPVTTISGFAFFDETSIETIDFGNVVTIGQSAFYGCASIRVLDLSGMIAIGGNAFNSFSALETLTIPISINTTGMFSGCIDLSKVILVKGIGTDGKEIVDGCNYIRGGGPWKFSTSEILEIEIGDGVRSIGNETFYEASKITSVSLPESVKTIGNYAFYGCTGLKTIDLSNVKTFGNDAFNCCIALEALDISGVVTIGAVAFASLYALETLTIPISINVHSMFSGTLLSKVTLVIGTDEDGDPLVDGYNYEFGSLTPWNISTSESLEVEIEEGIRSIGNETFREASKITSVSLPETVKSIGNDAFSGCTNIVTIDLSSVETIESYAFFNCTNLTAIDVGKAATIKEYAFQNCMSLKEITILASASLLFGSFWGCENIDELTVVGTGKIAWGNVFSDSTELIAVTISSNVDPDVAFGSYANIGSIVLPSTLTSIADNAFYNCTRLVTVTSTSLASIGNNAFQYCAGLTTISLGNVTFIGTGAFNGCSNLGTVDLSKAETIGDNAFSGCSKLKTSDLSKVTSIGAGAFDGCKELTSVDISKITSIGENAFTNCSKLEEIKMPATASAPGSSFYDCTKINKVTVVGTGTIAWSGSMFLYSTESIAVTIPSNVDPSTAFRYCTNIGSVVLPSTLTEIAENAFYRCTGLTTINLGNVTSIGASAFYNCSNLGTVDLSKAETIGNDAFYECTELKTSDLSKVTTLGEQAFYNCAGFENIVLSKVTSIGNGTFSGCTNLISIDISKVTSVGENAFSGCTNLATIDVSKVRTIGNNAFLNCGKIKTLDLSSAASIGTNVFNGLSSLETLTVPIFINISGIFSDCTLLKNVTLVTGTDIYDDPATDGVVYGYTSQLPWKTSTADVLSVTIGSGVTSVGDRTFVGCTNLKDIDLGTVTSIGTNAFESCTGLERITMNASASALTSSYPFYGCTNINKVTVIGTGTIAWPGDIFSSSGKLIDVVISDDVDPGTAFRNIENISSVSLPVSVTSLADDAFSGCTELVTVTATGLTSIENYAFYNCSKLTMIDLSKVTTIGNYAFYDCAGLTTFDLSKAETIGDYAFSGCSKLKTSDLSKVTSIGIHAFNGCAELTSVDISKITSIGENAFTNCSKLEEIKMPATASAPESSFYNCTKINKVTVVGTGTIAWSGSMFLYSTELIDVIISENVDPSTAFNNCANIGSIELPSTLTSIVDRAFQSCTGLVMVNAVNLDTIGVSAFHGCTNLTTIDLSKAETIGVSAFQGCTNLTTIDLSKAETIGVSAFQGCTALRTITLPISATFGNDAFSRVNADKITLTGTVGADHSNQPHAPWVFSTAPFELILEEGIEYIGTNTFYGIQLTSIVLPSTVTSIGANAFLDSNIESLTMPVSVETVASNAFSGCAKLNEITLTGVDGSDFTEDSQKELPWYVVSTPITVIISDTVESIGAYMFADLPGNVTIRTYNALQTVNMNAFNNSSGILALADGASMNDTTFLGKVIYYSGTGVLGAQAVLTDVDGTSGEGKVTIRFFVDDDKTPSSITVTDSVGDEITGTKREGRNWSFTSVGDEMFVVAIDYLDTYTITTETEGNGKIFYSINNGPLTESTGTIEVEAESGVRIFAVPDDYNEFVEWSESIGTFDGNDIVFSSDTSGDMGTVKAIFSLIVRYVTYEAGDYVVDVDPEATYGTSIEFTVTGDNAYVTVSIGGATPYVITPSSEGIYTISGNDITDDVHIVVVPTYLFTVPSNGSVTYKNITIGGSDISVAASGTFRIPFGHKVEITPTTTGFVMLDLDGNIVTGKLTIEDVSKDIVLKFIQSVKTETIDGNDVTFEITDLENAVVTTIAGSTIVMSIPSTVTIGDLEYTVTGIRSGAALGSSVQLVLISEGQTIGNTRGLVYNGPDANISISGDYVTISVSNVPEGQILIANVTNDSGIAVEVTVNGKNAFFGMSMGLIRIADLDVVLNIRDVTWDSEGGIEVNVSDEASYGTDLEFTVSDANAYVTVRIGSASPYVIEASEGVYTISGNDITGDIHIVAIPTYLFTVPANGSVTYWSTTIGGSGVDVASSETFRIPHDHNVTIASTANGYYMLDLDGEIVDGSLTINNVSADVLLRFIQNTRTETIDGNDITYEVEDLNNVSITEVSGDGKVLTLPGTVNIDGRDYNVSGVVSGALSGSSVELVVLSEGQTVGDAVRTMTYDGPSADVSMDGDTVTVAVNDINGRTLNAEVKDSDGNVIESTVEDGTVSFELPAGGNATVTTSLTGGDNDGDDGGSSAILFAAVGAVAAVVALGAVYVLFIRKP